MKKLTYLIAFLLITICQSNGQISISEASKMIDEYIKNLHIDDYLLYQKLSVNTSETTIKTFDKSISSFSFDSWLFFLDKRPFANWSHPCSYLFVDINSGKIQEKEWKLPPNDIIEWKLLNEIKEQPELDISESKNSKAVNLKSGGTADQCYAVILSGGYTSSENYKRYWNNCSAIYKALIDVYNYDEDHIYTLISDGTSTGIDRRTGPSTWDSSPLDLDSDGDNDIQYSATKANITTVFNTLKNILDSDDFLFIFVTDHGETQTGQDVQIYLWFETITDDQFETEVNKVRAGHKSIVMGQCYSGGFVGEFDNSNHVIATACDYDEDSYAMGLYTYDEFLYDWIAAVAGENPDGGYTDADDNNDGHVSMREAFDYAESLDDYIAFETPQYNSNKGHLGDNLTLLGYELCIIENVHNETINSDITIENCDIDIDNVTIGNSAYVIINADNDIEIDDLTIGNNADVIIDADNEVIIHTDFEVKLGSTLQIK